LLSGVGAHCRSMTKSKCCGVFLPGSPLCAPAFEVAAMQNPDLPPAEARPTNQLAPRSPRNGAHQVTHERITGLSLKAGTTTNTELADIADRRGG
jgi:hypothetical protein